MALTGDEQAQRGSASTGSGTQESVLARSIDFELRGDFIALAALLKSTGLAPSGAAAKALVADGAVTVDGAPELRKTCKIRAGQVVSLPGARIRVVAERAATLSATKS